LFYFTW
jgi:hypothetical protein